MARHNSDGAEAENRVADYLKSESFKILGKNWKTRWCEIDIIALKDKRVHFIEVKYRKTDSQGSGLEYITLSKLKQMEFAAQMWISNNDEYDEYVLSAAEATGPDYKVTFLEEI